MPELRPFFGRAAKMTVNPLDLADVHAMTGLSAAESVDALLITGGFPEVVQAWPTGMPRSDYLRRELSNPLSPLLLAGELSLLGQWGGVPEVCLACELRQYPGSAVGHHDHPCPSACSERGLPRIAQ